MMLCFFSNFIETVCQLSLQKRILRLQQSKQKRSYKNFEEVFQTWHTKSYECVSQEVFTDLTEESCHTGWMMMPTACFAGGAIAWAILLKAWIRGWSWARGSWARGFWARGSSGLARACIIHEIICCHSILSFRGVISFRYLWEIELMFCNILKQVKF